MYGLLLSLSCDTGRWDNSITTTVDVELVLFVGLCSNINYSVSLYLLYKPQLFYAGMAKALCCCHFLLTKTLIVLVLHYFIVEFASIMFPISLVWTRERKNRESERETSG